MRLLLTVMALIVGLGLPPSTSAAEKETTLPMDWKAIPGDAIDMDISMEGVVWIVTTKGEIKKWNGQGWDRYPGKAMRIAAGPRGNTWIVDPQNRIFRWGKTDWVAMPGKATDISVGASEPIWMIGTDPKPGGYGIYKWGVTDWVPVEGAAVRIAVGPKGNPWIINEDHEIFRLTRMEWGKAPGAAQEITIAANGVAWIIDGTEGATKPAAVRAWSGRNWVLYAGEMSGIATDARGRPWAFNSRNEIFADPRSVALLP